MKSTVTTKGGTVRMDTDQLQHLREELKKHAGAVVQIGVIGDTQRFEELGDTSLNNAELGMIHEFGVIGGMVKHRSRSKERKVRRTWDQFKDVVNIPERSFLRMPLIRELPEAIYKMGKEFWRKLIIVKGVIPALKNLGILGEATVQDAFATGGFGQWAPLKPRTIKRKGSSAILIDTAQLRQGIASRVVESAK